MRLARAVSMLKQSYRQKFLQCYRKAETPHSATEVELLGDHHDAYPSFTPIRQQIHPLALASRNPVEFPDHHGGDGARKDALLHAVKGWPFERSATFDIFEPLDGSGWHGVACEPTQDVRFLAVGLLPTCRDPAIARHHAPVSSSVCQIGYSLSDTVQGTLTRCLFRGSNRRDGGNPIWQRETPSEAPRQGAGR